MSKYIVATTHQKLKPTDNLTDNLVTYTAQAFNSIFRKPQWKSRFKSADLVGQGGEA